MTPPLFQPQPLLCAPPLFAKQPQFDYAFRWAAEGEGALGAERLRYPALLLDSQVQWHALSMLVCAACMPVQPNQVAWRDRLTFGQCL